MRRWRIKYANGQVLRVGYENEKAARRGLSVFKEEAEDQYQDALDAVGQAEDLMDDLDEASVEAYEEGGEPG